MANETMSLIELREGLARIEQDNEIPRFEIIVKEFSIQTKRDLDAANEVLKELKQRRKVRFDYVDPARESAWNSYKHVKKIWDDALGVIDKLISTLDSKMEVYVLAERRWEQEESDRQARQTEASQKALEAEAQRLLKRGEIEKAQQIMEVAEMPPPEIPKADLDLDGTTRREPWKARVTDLKALAAAVGAGLVPLEAIEANLPFLNAKAKFFAKELNYPGVKPYQTVQFAHRR